MDKAWVGLQWSFRETLKKPLIWELIEGAHQRECSATGDTSALGAEEAVRIRHSLCCILRAINWFRQSKMIKHDEKPNVTKVLVQV